MDYRDKSIHKLLVSMTDFYEKVSKVMEEAINIIKI